MKSRHSVNYLIPISSLMGLAMLFAPNCANASVVGSLGTNVANPFLTLSSSGLNGGSVATLAGGSLYTSDQPFADIPKGGVFGNTFLTAGPSSGNSATLSFTSGIDYLSFLWGSPDTYNTLSITSTAGVFNFTAAGLGFPVTNGDQTFSQYVQFGTGAGETILSATFSNSPVIDAFEVANFRVHTVPDTRIGAIPEPSTWAMMILGFAGVGFMAYRRSRKNQGLAFAA